MLPSSGSGCVLTDRRDAMAAQQTSRLLVPSHHSRLCDVTSGIENCPRRDKPERSCQWDGNLPSHLSSERPSVELRTLNSSIFATYRESTEPIMAILCTPYLHRGPKYSPIHARSPPAPVPLKAARIRRQPLNPPLQPNRDVMPVTALQPPTAHRLPAIGPSILAKAYRQGGPSIPAAQRQSSTRATTWPGACETDASANELRGTGAEQQACAAGGPASAEPNGDGRGRGCMQL